MSNVDFGLVIQPTPRGLPVGELLEYNRRCIRTLVPSFTTLWIEDHLQWNNIATLECLTTLSFLAAEFPDFHLGTLVLSQSYRNPALLAKMAANLHFLSGGRLILGLGTGWKEDEYHSYGYAFPTARVRLEQLEEAILIIRSMWSSQPANFMGQHYQVDDAYCMPRPSSPIPLLIGGGGEQRTLALVARYADWWNLNFSTVDEYRRKVAILHDHCSRIGRNLTDIRLTYYATVSVAEDPAEVVRHPHIHFVAGNSAEVVRELEQFCEIGVTHFMVRFPDLMTLERFVGTIVPHFI